MIKHFNLLLFLIYVTLDPAYAIITCEAEDNNSLIARNGHLTYDRIHQDISFETELKVEQIYGSIIICGERTWNIDPLPNCTSVDTSYDHIQRNSISCKQILQDLTDRQYSIATLSWDTKTGRGYFSCSTIEGSHYSYRLKSCSLINNY